MELVCARANAWTNQVYVRPWSQLARYGESIHLPMYSGGTFRTPDWLKDGTA